MTFSSADYPLFLLAVFAIHALTRIDGASGRVARVAVVVLLSDLLYLLLTKDVGTLWDPLGGLLFGALARDTGPPPAWQLPLGAAVAAGAAWLGWRHGAAAETPRAQRVVAWGALAAMAAVGVAVAVTHRLGALDALSAGFERVGHLLVLAPVAFAAGAAQRPAGRGTGRVVLLLVASAVFYHAWAAAQAGAYRYLLLLLLAIVVGDFLLGLAIDRARSPRTRLLLLLVSLVSNLGVLAVFKYADFFLLDVLRLDVEPLHLVLPAGISFHTFQSLSYTIDVYRRQLPATRSVLQFATFVLFFPQLVAGPIVRAHELLPQMDRLPDLDRRLAADGLFRIVVGLFKKIALADLLATLVVDRVFEAPGRFSGLEVLVGVWGYALQIYLDFSAYSDIAIGSAQLLGFRFPENFDTPYRSGNLQEFWRRWHITLSSWLRDYLYIPLGGARGGALRTYRNLIVTMLLGGLWHGASWAFVTWGALHGLGLAITRVFQRRAAGGAPMRRWILGTLALAAGGLGLHLALLDGDDGVLLHLVTGWLWLSPLWASVTAWLTLDDEPVTEPAAPPRPAAAREPEEPAAPPRPEAAPVDPRRAARNARRKQRRAQRGAVAFPVITADTRVLVLRLLAVVVGVAGLLRFVTWAAAPAWLLPPDGTPTGQPATMPPPGDVLPLAVACWLLAALADALAQPRSRAEAARWLRWAAKRAAAVLLTFHYVCVAWIFFRAPSFADAAAVLGQLATLTTDTPSLLPQVPTVLAVAALAHLFPPGTFGWARGGFARLPPWAQATVLVATALALRPLAAAEAAPFIYFQF